MSVSGPQDVFLLAIERGCHRANLRPTGLITAKRRAKANRRRSSASSARLTIQSPLSADDRGTAG
ncbi:MAG: hypothetical protein ABWY34_02905 [Pseudoxanthomonas sp.]